MLPTRIRGAWRALLLSLPVTLLCTASTIVENVLCLLVLGAVRALLLIEEEAPSACR